MFEAIVLAGGFGTRLKSVIAEIPKPMALINNRPFLEYQLAYLKKYGTRKIIFSVGYKHEFISDHFGNHFNDMEIEYAIEEQALGTGGGIRLALQKAETEDVLVVNGDTLFDVDLNDFYQKHAASKSNFSLCLRKIEDVSRYGSVEIFPDFRIKKFQEKGIKTGVGTINGGTYFIKKDFFIPFNFPEVFSLEKDCLEKLVEQQKFYGFPYESYFLDIGIPEDYKKAQDEFKHIGY
jgi:D-glycero-alpha-D-manno-heptose 1-phosphate guanylyltransferase